MFPATVETRLTPMLHELTEVSLVQLLSNQIASVGIYIFAKSFEIDYFANAFPYKYKTQHYQQRKVWYRNSSLGRHAARCAQAEFMEDNRVVTWHCFHGNTLFEI